MNDKRERLFYIVSSSFAKQEVVQRTFGDY